MTTNDEVAAARARKIRATIKEAAEVADQLDRPAQLKLSADLRQLAREEEHQGGPFASALRRADRSVRRKR